MAARKPRSKKPKAAPAPVEVVVDSPSVDEGKMTEEGFEKKRTRDTKGHFVKDDPSTPENEAYQWTKAKEAEDPKTVPTPTPAPVAKVAKKAPAKVAKADPVDYDQLTHSEIPLYGSERFRAKKSVKRGER